MSRRTILLAAHGAGDASPACTAIRALARALAARLPGTDVRVGFRLGTPALEHALQGASGDVIVLPILATRGYFTRRVLPDALGPALRGRRAVWSHPLGADPLVQQAIVRAACTRADNPWVTSGAATDAPGAAAKGTVARACGPGSGRGGFLVVGHGTERDRRSAGATHALAARLRRALAQPLFAPSSTTASTTSIGALAPVTAASALGGVAPVPLVAVGFLDQTPRLEDAARALPCDSIVVVPHLLGGGGHYQTDLRLRLLEARPELSPGRLVILPALLDLPGLADHVLRLIARGERRFAGRSAPQLSPAGPADAVSADTAVPPLRQADAADPAGKEGVGRVEADARRTGKVYLVGAGPGDPGLLTLRGLDALRSADVVLYDDLAPHELLVHLRPGARAIPVGKGPGDSATQSEIDALLFAHAQSGAVVVRLKGGDPCVFGRGWEEAGFLETHGIDCEFIPGVTSAVAVPELAGIPVTLREVARSFAVVTGHTVSDDTVDWDAASRLDTLVILMGVRTLPRIAARLLAAGRAPQTPVAIIEQGATPGQRTTRGPLGEIAAIAARAGVASPAVIVVGNVAGLTPRQMGAPAPAPRPPRRDWNGRRVLVTRPWNAASPLAAALRARGAEVIWCPLIAVEWIEGPSLTGLIGADWIVFDSRHGVDGFFRALAAADADVRCLGGKRIAAIGPATAAALWGHGIRADLVPDPARADALVAALCGLGNGRARRGSAADAPLAGVRVLFPAGTRAVAPIEAGLRAAGAEVQVVTVYRTVSRRPRAETAAALARGVDAILFHCPSAVLAFADAGLSVGDAVVVCVGGTTAVRAHALGLRPIVPKEHGDAAMLRAAEEAWGDDALRALTPTVAGAARATVPDSVPEIGRTGPIVQTGATARCLAP